MSQQKKPPTVRQLVVQLRELTDEKEKLEAQLKAVNKKREHVRTKLLPEALENAGLEKVSVEDVGSVNVSTKVYASVLAADRERLHEWLKDEGHGAMVKESVHHNTLSAFAEEQTAAGTALPDFVKVTFIPTANLRRK